MGLKEARRFLQAAKSFSYKKDLRLSRFDGDGYAPGAAEVYLVNREGFGSNVLLALYGDRAEAVNIVFDHDRNRSWAYVREQISLDRKSANR